MCQRLPKVHLLKGDDDDTYRRCRRKLECFSFRLINVITCVHSLLLVRGKVVLCHLESEIKKKEQ